MPGSNQVDACIRLSRSLQQEQQMSMQIFVRDLNGRILVLDVSPYDTTADLKEKIYSRWDLPPAEQRLVFAAKQLEDDCTLAHYSIQVESTVHIVLKLRGD